MFDMDFWTADGCRYIIEPRSKASGTYSSQSWLVVYDKKEKRYLTGPDSRAYLRFRNSEEIADYLSHLCAIKEEK